MKQKFEKMAEKFEKISEEFKGKILEKQNGGKKLQKKWPAN